MGVKATLFCLGNVQANRLRQYRFALNFLGSMFTNKVASKPQKFDIIAQSRLDVANA